MIKKELFSFTVAMPGNHHSWLRVPITDLYELGIMLDITKYSYYDKRTCSVYLNEDYDIRTYLDALKNKMGMSNENIHITVIPQDNDDFLRGMKPFISEMNEKESEGDKNA